MTTLKKYDLTGKEVGELKVADDLLDCTVNHQSMKDYLVAIRNNKRQWSANTKGRSEINHSNAKPHPQKGTGKARQGTLAAPQYKGGGIVFGPKPKFDQHVRINKKERRAAIRFLICEKIRAGKMIILESTKLDGPKTKTVANFLKKVGVKETQRTLFLGESFAHSDGNETDFNSMCNQNVFIKSMSNIPKSRFKHAKNISGLDMADGAQVIVMDEAVSDLMLMLGA